MYRHVLIPVDCSEEMRRAVPMLADFLGPLVPCRVTLVASVSASSSEELREKKVKHAQEALRSIGNLFHGYGIYTDRRIGEVGEMDREGDPAIATTNEANRRDEVYDLILLGTHHTRPDKELPCSGSLADRICRRSTVPALVLPTQPAQSVLSPLSRAKL